MVYGICRMLLRDPNEAEDATQQVFLSAYRNLLTGTEVREPAAWLGTIARNACRRRAQPGCASRWRSSTTIRPGLPERGGHRGRARSRGALRGACRAAEAARSGVPATSTASLRRGRDRAGNIPPRGRSAPLPRERRLQRRLRPGLVAGVLVVPLAVQVDRLRGAGFASTAATPAAAAVGIPLIAKLAAAEPPWASRAPQDRRRARSARPPPRPAEAPP